LLLREKMRISGKSAINSQLKHCWKEVSGNQGTSFVLQPS